MRRLFHSSRASRNRITNGSRGGFPKFAAGCACTVPTLLQVALRRRSRLSRFRFRTHESDKASPASGVSAPNRKKMSNEEGLADNRWPWLTITVPKSRARIQAVIVRANNHRFTLTGDWGSSLYVPLTPCMNHVAQKNRITAHPT